MMATTILHIEGMSCQHCVRHVKEALEEMAGVQSANVDLEAKTATVEHAAEVTRAAFAEAIDDAGYELV